MRMGITLAVNITSRDAVKKKWERAHKADNARFTTIKITVLMIMTVIPMPRCLSPRPQHCVAPTCHGLATGMASCHAGLLERELTNP